MLWAQRNAEKREKYVAKLFWNRWIVSLTLWLLCFQTLRKWFLVQVSSIEIKGTKGSRRIAEAKLSVSVSLCPPRKYCWGEKGPFGLENICKIRLPFSVSIWSFCWVLWTATWSSRGCTRLTKELSFLSHTSADLRTGIFIFPWYAVAPPSLNMPFIIIFFFKTIYWSRTGISNLCCHGIIRWCIGTFSPYTKRSVGVASTGRIRPTGCKFDSPGLGFQQGMVKKKKVKRWQCTSISIVVGVLCVLIQLRLHYCSLSFFGCTIEIPLKSPSCQTQRIGALH